MIVAPQRYDYYELSRNNPTPQRRAKLTHRRKVGLKVLLVGAVLSGFVFGLVLTFYYLYSVRLGYQVVALQNEIASIKKENAYLELEVARLKSLDRIEQVATTRLGMVKPQEVEMLQVARNQPVSPGKGASTLAANKQAASALEAPTKNRHPLIEAAAQMVASLPSR
ncbi:MAG: septum formation initiator family protein [Firmicutes bacterium]|nr:septum formation initiator family protein [Bacillota bacterium]